MTNKWVEHIKTFAKSHNIAYGCALSNPECLASYKAKNNTTKSITKSITKNDVKVKEPSYVYEKRRKLGKYDINKEIYPLIKITKEEYDQPDNKHYAYIRTMKKSGVIL